MNIQAEKIQLAKMLLDTQNPNVIESIKNIFKKESKKDFWYELSNEQKAEIEKASIEIEKGETVKYEDFIKKYR